MSDTVLQMPPITPGPRPAGASSSPADRSWARWLGRDRLVLGAVATCALLLGYQLAVTILRPPWIGPATDWLRAALTWLELGVVVGVSLWLTRRGRPEAVMWWLLSGGVLSYAIARTWWTVDDALIYHHGVPFPILPDLFFVLQYPFYILAVICIPCLQFWGPRLVTILDALLWMAAAASLVWYFLVAPLVLMSGLTPLARAVSLGYPVADLFLLLALSLVLLRPLRLGEDRPVVGLVIASVACLIVADAFAVWLLLRPAHTYRTGQLPDLFWLASDLLIPLAAIVQLRVVQRAQSRERPAAECTAEPAADGQGVHGLQEEDLRAALRLFVPLVAALLASVAILLRAAMTAPAGVSWQEMVAPLAVSSFLLLLVIIRQGVMFLDAARLRRAVEVAQAKEQAARAEERALRELDRRKDEFLSVISHELRTPLTSLAGFIELLLRRFDTERRREEGAVGRSLDRARDLESLQTALVFSQLSVQRLTRLADDLADDARIRHGRLAVHLGPCDLDAVVRAAVEEQRALEPDRTIVLEMPTAGQPTPVLADADRIAQVIANYLTNALKYSREERPVVVRLEVEHVGGGDADGEGAMARVSVRDEGIGVPAAEQPHIWERLYVVEENKVQSGSGISLGLGLHISKAIVEEHHGQVGVDSSPGRGSTFWFTLPLACPAAPA